MAYVWCLVRCVYYVLCESSQLEKCIRGPIGMLARELGLNVIVLLWFLIFEFPIFAKSILLVAISAYLELGS